MTRIRDSLERSARCSAVTSAGFTRFADPSSPRWPPACSGSGLAAGDDWPAAGGQRSRGRHYRSRCHHDDRRRGPGRAAPAPQLDQRRQRGIVPGAGNGTDHDGHGRSGRQRQPSGRLRAVGGSLPAPHGQRVPQLAPRPASRSGDDRQARARFVVDRRLRQRQRRDRVDLRGRRRAVSDRDRRRDQPRRLPTATRRSKLLGCTPKSATDMACFQSFVTKFGRLAWRQPLTPAQVTRYATLIANVAATLGDVNEGMRAGLQGLLLSPNFLYRIERGAPPAAGGAMGSGSTRAARSPPGSRTS